MGLISKTLRKTTTGFIWWCPGCKQTHGINVRTTDERSGPNWSWNNDPEKPSFSPSILVRGTRQDLTDEEEVQFDKDAETLTRDQLMDHPVYSFRCHSFVENGHIRFLNDCTHELANQTVPIPHWPFTPEEFHIPKPE
jgi:hypothetical protein